MIDGCEFDRRLLAWWDMHKGKRLAPHYKLVALEVARWVDPATGKAKVDVREIAGMVAVNKETVVNGLAAAEAAGMLERMEKGRPGGPPSIYRLVPNLMDDAAYVRRGRTSLVRRGRNITKEESKKESPAESLSPASPPVEEEVVLGKEAPPAEGNKRPRKPKKTHRPWQPGTDWLSNDEPPKIVPASLTDRYPLATENMAGFLENAIDRDGWMRRKEDRPWPMLLKGVETMLSQMQAGAIDKQPPEEIIPLKPWTKLRRGSPELAQMIWKLFEQDMRNCGHMKEYHRNGDDLPGYGLPPHVRKIVWEEALPDIHPDERFERRDEEHYRKRLRRGMPGGGR